VTTIEGGMKKLKEIGIRQLKAKLSSYLRQVEDGETFLVTTRRRKIAKLSKIEDDKDSTKGEAPIIRAWHLSGEIELPKRKKISLSTPPLPELKVSNTLIDELISSERGEL